MMDGEFGVSPPDPECALWSGGIGVDIFSYCRCVDRS